MKFLPAFLIIFQLIGLANAQKTKIINVVSFKANGADTLDDTKAIQACINYVASKGGGTVFFPKGTYYISNQKIPGKAICLLAKNMVSLSGEDEPTTVLKLAANQPGFSSILSLVNTKNISVDNISFDGNYTNQSNPQNPNEHLHGIFIDQAVNLKINHCSFINTGGDGLGIRGIVTPGTNIKINHCSFNNNKRNGITLGSGFKDITIKNCYFGKDIANDAIHTEPSGQHFFGNVLIENNLIETPHLLTIAGSSPESRAHDFVVRNNVLKRCSVYIIYAENITIENNKIDNSDKRSAVTLLRRNNNISIRNNTITVNNFSAFTITYSVNGYSQNVVIDSNVINFNAALTPCFAIKGCDSIKIINNKIAAIKNSKNLVEVVATRTITGFEFSNNNVDYFEQNFNLRSIKNNSINNVSIRNNIFKNGLFKSAEEINLKANKSLNNIIIEDNQ